MTPTNDCNKLNQILLFSVDVVDGHGPTARRPPIAAAPTPQKWRRQAPPMPPKSLCPSSLTRARRTRSTCRPRRRRHDRCLVSPFHFAVVASCSLFPLFSCSFILPDSLTHSSGLLVSSGSSSGGASRPEWRPQQHSLLPEYSSSSSSDFFLLKSQCNEDQATGRFEKIRNLN